MQEERTEIQVIFICLKEEMAFVREESKYTMEAPDVRQEDIVYETVMEDAYRFLKEYRVARNHKDLLLRSIFRK